MKEKRRYIERKKENDREKMTEKGRE